ncbi:hypothetical protein LCGC14_1241620 [marine sediment metagenome]|uniref:Uncharacterized protein n=1 Tax=marine sediment metagenome TaxID=412755 RepID=A0A0F9NMT4_9ZZZZ
MPNQKNFPDEIQETPNLRPRRVSQEDRILLQDRKDGRRVEKEVVFGQTNRDVVEIFVFDELNNIVGHVNLRPNDKALRLIAFTPNQQVGIGQDQTPDVLQIDLVNVLLGLGSLDESGKPEGLPPGRYSIAVNLFRDEVGQEAGGVDRRLFISDISPSRKELRLRPAFSNDKVVHEINEFVEPSVPRFVAQAIVDQAFGISLDLSLSPAGISVESIDFTKFEEEIARLDQEANRENESTTANRIRRSGLGSNLFAIFGISVPQIRNRILDALAKDVKDLQIQDVELQKFIRDGIGRTLINIINSGQVDPRLQILNRDGVPITLTSTRLRTE